MAQTVEELIKKFLDEISRLVDEYGDSPVEAALSQILGPEFDIAEPVSTLGFDSSIVDSARNLELEEQISRALAAKDAVGKVAGWIKGIKPGKGPKKPPKGAGTGTAAVGGAASGAVSRGLAGAGAAGLAGALGSKWVDQEVDIADISTTDKLGVTIDRGSAPYLETLLGQTNVLIQKMIDLLAQSQPDISRGLDAVDLSIDDMVASKTGETPEDVQTRQEMNPNTPPPSTKTKNKKQRKK